jgi:cytoskeletal protein CcmA (bactofilin family)
VLTRDFKDQNREAGSPKTAAALPESTATEPRVQQMPPVKTGTAATGRLSIIGNDLAIMGERIVIITKGALQVDGDVQADLHGAEVIVGETGRVTGTIWADAVEVRGQVHGTIRGTKVQLMEKSSVEGDIHHQMLTVAEGANFDGRARRPTDPQALKPNLDPTKHAGKVPSSTLR